MRDFITTFGSRMSDIAITGKAGICAPGGKKYDIMLPSYIIPQISQGVFVLPNGNQLTKAAITDLQFKGQVFENGPMLTVPGTVLQNEHVYQSYLRNHHIIGAEMEAGPYLDAIEKGHCNKNLNQAVRLFVGHWASDVPLDPSQSLAKPHLEQGYIPQYTLIAAILNSVLKR
jgi:hypothetical protein